MVRIRAFLRNQDGAVNTFSKLIKKPKALLSNKLKDWSHFPASVWYPSSTNRYVGKNSADILAEGSLCNDCINAQQRLAMYLKWPQG